MARARVKPEDAKGIGRPISLDIGPYHAMGEALIKWAETARSGSLFDDFICDTPYTTNMVEHACAVDETFARQIQLAKRTLARGWRDLAVNRNNSNVSKMLPLVCKQYAALRREELKLEALAKIDPRAALDEISNQSQSPIKD